MIPVDLLNYQLIRVLGRGGMGEVYLARNKNIEQYVAVKALHPKYADNPMLRARFKQEAVMLNSLNHPNIVKFLNFVENEYGVFLIMEYVEGCTLEEFITHKNGLIVEEKAYPMMKEILDAFSYAHRHGIIHRDIKPNNIFLDKEGHIKVMDFGIAQIISEVNSAQGGGSSMGTPAYMSPEQVYGQKLDQRSDIYSLGVLFHQMLTGRAPYDSTTMSELEIKKHVVNETLPKMKNYYPYINRGLQYIVDKATSKERGNRYATCEEMLKAIKNVLNPDKSSKTFIYIGIAAALVCIIAGLGIYDYFRTKVDYYKDYAEFYGVAKGIGSLSNREMSHREMSYRIESSRWKVRRITLVNSKDKSIPHKDTEHINSRFTDVYYYYSDNGKVDYKKVYDAYGKLLYKIDYDENLKVAMFKHDDEHGTAKRLLLNTTQLYNVNSQERSSITRYLLTYDEKGLLQKLEYASGEDNTPIGDAENIYGHAYSYDKEGRITEEHFLGQDGKIRSNKIGLAIKQYEYDDDDNWVQVMYLSADGNPSHDGNNCPLVRLGYDQWGNRTSERYYTVDGQPSYRADISACGFMYEFDGDGYCIRRKLIDGSGNVMVGKDGYAQINFVNDENGFVTRMEFLDKEGNRTNSTMDEGDIASIITKTVDERGLDLSIAYYNTQEMPLENSMGVHKVVCEYDSIGNILKAEYLDKDLKPAKYAGFNSSVRYTYTKQYLRKSMSYYDEDGQLTYNEDGVAQCLYTYDKTGNIIKYEYVDKDGKTLVNSRYGFAVEEVDFDALGNMKSIRHYDSSLHPCMSSYGYYAKEFIYDGETNFTTEEKYTNANNSVIQIDRYTYDGNGNKTAIWTVNGFGSIQGVMTHYEYDENNRVVKLYYTNLSGKRVNGKNQSYCEMNTKYDARGNLIEETYLGVNGKPAYDSNRTHQRLKEYDERNRNIYEKNLDKDGKPIHGNNTNPELKLIYDDYGHVISLICLDGYGNPYICTEGFHRLERKYNENNLIASECYKNEKGNLVTHRTNKYAKVTYTYDSKRNIIKEKYFGSDGALAYYVTCNYNNQNSLVEACMYNDAGKLSDSRAGFSRFCIAYTSDGVTPTTKIYYKGGKLLAWQSYNNRTGEWGKLNF